MTVQCTVIGTQCPIHCPVLYTFADFFSFQLNFNFILFESFIKA